MSYRPEFEAALRLLAQASEALVLRGLPRPILVGGAAAELYSTSAVMTGDVDLCTPVQVELEEEFEKLGFVKPAGAGKSLRGWMHPELALGFEVVADTPMDGTVDPARLRLVRPAGEAGLFRVIPVEDPIADRVGQFASGTAPDRLRQAQILFALHPDADLAYLERRIREESAGEYGVEDIRI